MPKITTLKIQKEISELGMKLGFVTCLEEQIHNKNRYAPIYDAVWYLDLTKFFDISALERIFINAPFMVERMKKLPVAGFEIEGASTSSKNQLGNLGNLYSGHFLYNFVIVNNCEANGENDTYRRGRKLYKYLNEEFEAKNTIFMDYTHLKKSIESLKDFNINIKTKNNIMQKRKNFGGDTTSISMFDTVFPFLLQSGLEINQNYSPQMPKIKFRQISELFQNTYNIDADFMLGKCYYSIPTDSVFKSVAKPSDMYYIPKLDVVAGFYLPSVFSDWLYQLSIALGNDCNSFPILYALKNKIVDELFVPLVSIEFENKINKHCNGGIINMAHYSYFGILVGTESAQSHIDFLKENMGINNVTFLNVGDLK